MVPAGRAALPEGDFPRESMFAYGAFARISHGIHPHGFFKL